MATVDASIPLGVKSPTIADAMSNMSSLLGVKQQQQTLQQQEVKTQQDQNMLQEQQALGSLKTRDYIDPDTGIFDADRYMKDAMAATPRTGLGVQRANDVYKLQGAQLGVQSAAQDLDLQTRQKAVTALSGVGTMPGATYKTFVQTADDLKKSTPAASQVVDQLLSHLDPNASMDQNAKKLKALTWAVVPPKEQLPAADTKDLGATLQPGITESAMTGGGFTSTGKPLTKATPQSVMQSPGGPIVRVGPGGTSMSAIPDSGSPTQPAAPNKLQPLQRPGLNAPAADQANYATRIKQAGDEYQAVSGAANDPQNGVQVSRYRNGQILNLTQVAPTGPGKDIWNHFASQIPGEGADAFQKIGHYLAQNSAAMAGKMGVPNTNMGQETAAAAAGNTAQNPKAIAEITRVNDALNTGFDLYNRGLAKVTNNGSDLSRAAAYKQAFGQNLDVNALRWADAHRRGDTQEINELRQKFGDNGISGWTQKLNSLKSLATQGDLP